MTNFEDKLDQALFEYELLPAQGRHGKTRVYVNPPNSITRKVLESFKEIGGLLAKKDLYLWNRDDLDHDSIMLNYGIRMSYTRNPRNPIPFYIINGVITLSPVSYLGVDPAKDVKKIQGRSTVLASLKVNIKYFNNS